MRAAVWDTGAVQHPLTLMASTDDLAVLRLAAREWGAQWPAVRERPAQYPEHGRVRVALFSADFWNHATCWLLAPVLEALDRRVVEVWAVSWGGRDDAMRARVRASVEHWVDVSDAAGGWTDATVADWARSEEIDVAVDLKGYTTDARPGIFAERPAPVVVSWLGFPGTMGVPWVDVLLADSGVVPWGAEQWYDERVVRLRGGYQPPRRVRAEGEWSREAAGLPEGTTVFGALGAEWKITPEMVRVWGRILDRVPGSVLWALAESRFRLAALGSRVVYCPRLAQEMHLGRMRLADVVLDTWPYGGHTTTSDALACGVGVVTRAGRSMASRVAGALAGVAAGSEEEYVKMAVAGRGGLGVQRQGVEGWTRELERAWVELSRSVEDSCCHSPVTRV